MKIVDGLKFFIAVFFLVAVSLAQVQAFSGIWQSRTIPLTGKPTITVIIDESGKGMSGRVILVNPDRTQIEMPILNPSVRARLLTFQTHDETTSYDWRVTLKKNGRTASLRLSFREALMEANLVKQRPTHSASDKKDRKP